jgi:hypothetical protein
MTVESSPTRNVAIERGGKIAQNLHPLAAGWAIWGGNGWPGLGLAVAELPFMVTGASTLTAACSDMIWVQWYVEK